MELLLADGRGVRRWRRVRGPELRRTTGLAVDHHEFVPGAAADRARRREGSLQGGEFETGVLVLVRGHGQLRGVVHVLELGHGELVVRDRHLDQAAVGCRGDAEPFAVAWPLSADAVDAHIERDQPLVDEERAERVQDQVVALRQRPQVDQRLGGAVRQPGRPALHLADLVAEQRQDVNRRQGRIVARAPGQIEVRGDLEEQQRDGPSSARPPRGRALQLEPEVDAEEADAEGLERDACRDVDDERERGEPEQGVEAEVALEPEVIEAQDELGHRPELHGVAGDGEVAGYADTGERLVDDVDRDARRHRERQGRRLERGMEAAHRQDEVSLAPADEQAHAPLDRHEQDA